MAASFADFDKQASALSFEDFDRQARGPESAPPSWLSRFSTALGRNVREGWDAAEPAQTSGKKLLQAIVPTTPTGVGAAAGSLAAGAKVPAIVAKFPALWRVFGGAVGGEAGGQVEGRTTGAGAVEGGGGTAIGETAMAYGPALVRSLPWMKGLISRMDTRRVGHDLEGIVGTPPMKTPVDFGTQATRAYQQEAADSAAYEVAQQGHKQLVSEAKLEAARRTRDARLERAAEWERRKTAYKTDKAGAEESQRLGAIDLIRDVTPQIESALQGSGSGSTILRSAAKGGAKRALDAEKEAFTRTLETAAPDGILMPSLTPQGRMRLDPSGEAVPAVRVSVREALKAYSDAATEARTQLARAPGDRNIQGADPRARVAELANEIRAGLNDAWGGLGDVFQKGQDVYREGITVTNRVLRQGGNWPGGEFSVRAASRRLNQPVPREIVENRLGPEKTETLISGLDRLAGAVPPPPAKPLQVAPTMPDIPPAPVKPTQTAGDLVMSEMFGPKGRILHGRDTLVNWPAAQETLELPAVRAALESHPQIGPAGYQRLKDTLLRGAAEGKDVPAAGSGRLFGPVMEWASGREKGAGYAASLPIRAFLPNLGAHYVGKAPLTPSPIVEKAAALASQRGVSEVTRDTQPKPAPDLDRIFKSKGITPELAASWADANRVASQGTLREKLSHDPNDRISTLRAAFSGAEGQKELRKKLSPEEYEAVRKAVFSKPSTAGETR